MAMTDAELEMWAAYGDAQRQDNVPLGLGGPELDIRQLWLMIGELSRRVRQLES